MSQVNNDGSIRSIIESIDLGPTASLQMLFAKLNLAQAQLAKNGAMENIEKIQQSQEAQKEAAAMIAKARDLQNQAKASGNTTEMPADMQAYFQKNGLKWDTAGSDAKHNKDEWEYNIQSLTAYRDQLGTDTQQLMVFVQDFMGQYNSYLQGANSAIQQGNQTLQSIATGR